MEIVHTDKGDTMTGTEFYVLSTRDGEIVDGPYDSKADADEWAARIRYDGEPCKVYSRPAGTNLYLPA